MLKSSTILFVLSCTFCGAFLANAANLVVNPGFESGDLTAWTISGAHSDSAGEGIYYGVDTIDAHSGTYGAYFGPPEGVIDLSQNVATIPGATYTFSFWLAHSGPTPFPYTNSFAVSFAGNTLFTASNVSAGGYQQYSYTAVAQSASTNVSFMFRDDTSYFSLDDISVSSSAVPEPASLLLLAVPLALLPRVRRVAQRNT
jgi:Carbohydrate binding domain